MSPAQAGLETKAGGTCNHASIRIVVGLAPLLSDNIDLFGRARRLCQWRVGVILQEVQWADGNRVSSRITLNARSTRSTVSGSTTNTPKRDAFRLSDWYKVAWVLSEDIRLVGSVIIYKTAKVEPGIWSRFRVRIPCFASSRYFPRLCWKRKYFRIRKDPTVEVHHLSGRSASARVLVSAMAPH